MQKIPITLAEPDMILAQPIMQPDKPDGLPIFGKGAELTATSIERLKLKGIQSVAVEGHPVIIEGEESLDEILIMMEQRFEHLHDDEYMMNILETFKKQISHAFGVDYE